MKQRLEPCELVAAGEDALGDARSIDLALIVQHAVAEPLDDRALHALVGAEEVVDDLVARDGRRAKPRERAERLGLAGADPAGDRDRDRSPQATRAGRLLRRRETRRHPPPARALPRPPARRPPPRPPARAPPRPRLRAPQPAPARARSEPHAPQPRRRRQTPPPKLRRPRQATPPRSGSPARRRRRPRTDRGSLRAERRRPGAARSLPPPRA